MLCKSCSYEQNEGKFCGKCGAEMNELNKETSENIQLESHEELTEELNKEQSVSEERSPAEIPAQPNENIELVKTKSKIYFSYFKRYLKNPMLSYNLGEKGFFNSLISIILLVIMMNLALYIGIKDMIYYLDQGIFTYFIGIAFFLIAAITIAITAILIINKAFGPKLSFKHIASMYGAHLSPALVVAVVALLLMLLKSYTYGSFALIIILSFILSILPFYLVVFLLTKHPVNVDPLYGFLCYIIISFIFNFILITVFADSFVGYFIDNLENLFDPYYW